MIRSAWSCRLPSTSHFNLGGDCHGPLVTTAGPQLAGEGQCFNATCQFSRTVRGAEVPPELATVSQTAVFVYFFEDSTCQPVDHDRKLSPLVRESLSPVESIGAGMVRWSGE